MKSATQQLAESMRSYRKALHLSQKIVAQLAGKAQSQIARLESGAGNPSYEIASQVLRSLGVELVAVPIRLLPAVRHLIDAAEGGPVPQRTRLVGNDPESATEEDRGL